MVKNEKQVMCQRYENNGMACFFLNNSEKKKKKKMIEMIALSV